MNVNTEQLLHFLLSFARDFTEFVEFFSYNLFLRHKPRFTGIAALPNIDNNDNLHAPRTGYRHQ